MIVAIADDVTGATDVAVAFRRRGLGAAIIFGVPSDDAVVDDCDVLVIALKSRTIPAKKAVTQSLDSVSWSQRRGVEQFFFKCCSTFDSSPLGNIGPVADALADRLGSALVIVTPASPLHERTVYEGNLFVGSQLLSESSLRAHPLTPMTDANLVRVLSGQSERRVGHLRHRFVEQGAEKVETELGRLLDEGFGYAIVDAINEADLITIGKVAASHVLVVGSAGLAEGIAAALAGDRGADGKEAQCLPDLDDYRKAAVLAGSCSARTIEQVRLMARDNPAYRLDAMTIPDSDALATAAMRWYDELISDRSPVIYSSLGPEELRQTQSVLGVAASAEVIESAMARIACGLIERGVNRFVVAGGETSGSVMAALGVAKGIIGDEAGIGVPWIFAEAKHPIALLLKSGNFGDASLLARASSEAPVDRG